MPPESPTVRRGSASRLWSLVVPLKDPHAAKSRLALPPAARVRLVQAMARDTIRAARRCPGVAGVLVVGARLDPGDPGPTPLATLEFLALPATGMNAAVRAGLSAARRAWPDRGVAVLSADLPTLRPADLEVLLVLADQLPLACAPDASGAGTVFLAGAHRYAPGVPAFGERSRARHAHLGARVLWDAPARARRDVDTLSDLRAALRLGVGPDTDRAVADQANLTHSLL